MGPAPTVLCFADPHTQRDTAIAKRSGRREAVYRGCIEPARRTMLKQRGGGGRVNGFETQGGGLLPWRLQLAGLGSLLFMVAGKEE